MDLQSARITKTGQLEDVFLPAVYLDTSVVIDYWMVEHLEFLPSGPEGFKRFLSLTTPSPRLEIMREILKSDVRLAKVAEVKSNLISQVPKVTPIISPLCLLEFTEWHAETVFRETASQATSVRSVRRLGKKDIGEYIKKLTVMRMAETEQLGRAEPSVLESLLDDFGPPEIRESLEGLWYADIIGFELSFDKTWQEIGQYSWMQVGVADIFHILLAQHIGCEYLASFDSDFVRMRDFIKETTGISVLARPEELLDII
jgi:hypothetical protein